MEARIASPLAGLLLLADRLCENLITHVHPSQWSAWILSIIESLNQDACTECEAYRSEGDFQHMTSEIISGIQNRNWKK